MYSTHIPWSTHSQSNLSLRELRGVQLATKYLQRVIGVTMQKQFTDLATAPYMDLLEVLASVCQHSNSFQWDLTTPGDVQFLQPLPASLTMSHQCNVIATVRAVQSNACDSLHNLSSCYVCTVVCYKMLTKLTQDDRQHGSHLHA